LSAAAPVAAGRNNLGLPVALRNEPQHPVLAGARVWFSALASGVGTLVHVAAGRQWGLSALLMSTAAAFQRR